MMGLLLWFRIRRLRFDTDVYTLYTAHKPKRMKTASTLQFVAFYNFKLFFSQKELEEKILAYYNVYFHFKVSNFIVRSETRPEPDDAAPQR
jgi:hypothetical protein